MSGRTRSGRAALGAGGRVLGAVGALAVVGAGGARTARAEAGASIEQAAAHRHVSELALGAGRPEALAALAALLRLEHDLPSGALEPALHTVVDNPAADADVAAHAAFHLARLLEERGADAEAAAVRRKLGLHGDFWVVGPFDAQGRSSLRRRLAPEETATPPGATGVAAGAVGAGPAGGPFAGKERDVAWRRVPAAAVRGGVLWLDALMRPDSDAVAYVLAAVSSPRATGAMLRVGSSGPLRVWLNGDPVLERDALRAAGLDQDVAPVRLRRGTNLILLKTLNLRAAAWRIVLRFSDARGRPLTEVAPTIVSGLAPVTARAAGWPAPRPVGGGARALSAMPALGVLALRAERAAGPAAAGAWLDYARALWLVGGDDEESGRVESALDRAAAGTGPHRTLALLMLGEVARQPHRRRAALDAALASCAEPACRARALTALGDLARHEGRESDALFALREAAAADPAYWRAAVALASEEQAAGMPARAWSRLAGLPDGVRRLPRVVKAAAAILRSLGRRAEAAREIEALLARRPGDVDLLQTLGAEARDRGDLRRAAALHLDAAARRPDLAFLVVEGARALESAGAGGAAESEVALRAALDRLPDEASLHEALGRLLWRTGRTADAVLALRRVLDLRPQNPALRREVERLAGVPTHDGAAPAGTPARDLAEAEAADATAIAARALSAPARDAPVDAATVLLDRHVVRLHDNGLQERLTQRVLHVETAEAARRHREFEVAYVPASQEVEVRAARIFRRGAAGGIEIVEGARRDDRALSDPGAAIYYDYRAEVVVFDDLRAGDVVEVTVQVSDIGPQHRLADLFGDLRAVSEALPKRRWEYVLVAPPGRSFTFRDPRIPGFERRAEAHADGRAWRLGGGPVPRIESEPSMPGAAEVAEILHVSTAVGWDEIGAWYARFIEDQLAPDPEVRRAALAATAGLRGPPELATFEKVRALHRTVVEGTRYVALEFGVHGYRPYKVGQVLSRRFGDCKDKAGLLVALLGAVGIEAEMVLLRTRSAGLVDRAPASLAVFDHAIVYVPSVDLYLDGTAEFAGMTELPAEDQGALALRVGRRTRALVLTPVAPATKNRAARRWRVEVGAEGGGHIAEEIRIEGQAAPEWRVHYQTASERRERMSQVWSRRFPGARLESFDMPGIEDRSRPVVVRSHVRVPVIGEPAHAGALALRPTAREGDFVRSYAALATRRWDLQIAYPWRHEEALDFALAPGWRVARVPARTRLRGPFGRFDLEVRAQGRLVRVRSTVQVDQHRVAAGAYPEFRQFLGAIDAALAGRIVIERDDPRRP